MIKQLTFLILLLGLVLIGCTKDDTPEDVVIDDDDEIINILSVEVNEIDNNKTWSFQGSDDDDQGYIARLYSDHDTDNITYQFMATDTTIEHHRIIISLKQREGGAQGLKIKEYTLGDPDFYLYINLTSSSTDTYVIGEDYDGHIEERKYNGETVTPYYWLKITELSDEYIEAEFEFDAYTYDRGNNIIKKATFRNGEIKGSVPPSFYMLSN